MFAFSWDEFGFRGAGVLVGLLIGTGITWIVARWKRIREYRNILRGDARDTVVISHHLVESVELLASQEGFVGKKVAGTLRIRSLGQSELNRVVPNGHLAADLLHRAFQTTPKHTLIGMDGPEGSYLLETLTNFVCDRVANAPFHHDLYVLAPCCEPAGIAVHQPITILIIAVDDLALFEDWPSCRDVQVEHGTDGMRILTLMELARRYKREQLHLNRLRKNGERTRYMETMYILDLALDHRTAPIPTRPVLWGRFERELKELNLE